MGTTSKGEVIDPPGEYGVVEKPTWDTWYLDRSAFTQLSAPINTPEGDKSKEIDIF